MVFAADLHSLNAGNRAADPRVIRLMYKGNLGAAFARGTLWSLGLRWTVKLIGLISTVILARLLSPEDFGVVAMAMLCISLRLNPSRLGIFGIERICEPDVCRKPNLLHTT